MKHTDNQIREIFSSKLKELESDVPAGMWEAVSSQITTAGLSSSVAASAKFAVAKWIAAAIVTTSVVGSLVIYLNKDQETAQLTPDQQAKSENVLSEAVTKDQEQIDANTAILQDEIKLPESVTSQSVTKDEEGLKSEKQIQTNNSDQKEEIPAQHIGDQLNQLQNSEHIAAGDERKIEDQQSVAADNTITEESALSAGYNVAAADRSSNLFFFMAEDVDAKTYHWDFGDGNESSEMSVMHEYAEEGHYTVTLQVTDDKGAQLSKTNEIAVFAPGKIEVPTIFTPNGDGRNDYFDINEKSTGLQFTMVVIRDSKEKIVFEGDGSTLWDGFDRSGNACMSGSYQYYLKAIDRNQEIIEKRGIVYLER